MRVVLTFILILAINFHTQSQQTLGFRLPEGRTRITIPIEVYSNLIVMPVVINGQLPLKFILDTGVRTTILTEKSYSDILGLPYSRQYSIATPGGEHMLTAYIANNVSIYIPPGIRGTGHAMLVLEKDYLELRNYLGAEVHGVLGYELFSRFVVLINYQEKFVELIDPAVFKPKGKFQALDITVEDTKPFLKTNVLQGKKKEVKLLVDTGASHGLMLDPASDKEIVMPEKNIATIIGRALGGEITGKIGRIQSLDLGRAVLKDVITSYPDPNSYMDTLKATSVLRNGSIGGEVLTRFTVIFNYSKEKMYLKKNSVFKKEFQNDLSGLTIKAKGARLKVFEVISVREKSPSHKEGILKGDILVLINGVPAGNYGLTEITAELNSKPGRKVTLTIDRAGEKLKKTITLQSGI
jgi:predicted aspartyl protease